MTIDDIAIERENVTEFLDKNFSWKQHINDVSTKISKSIGILYKPRGIVKQFLLKQWYFAFIHCHLSYANITWASTYKSKLEGLYHHQEHAALIINFNDKFTHTTLLYDMKALNIFQINLLHIIYLMFKCKEKIVLILTRDRINTLH